MPQPNIQNMLKQAQEVMAAQQEAQEALKEQKVESSAGGGMVKVVVSGDLRLESLTIDPDAVDPEDVEMLQDMLVAALNEALRKAEELQQSKMGEAEGMGGFDPMSALESLGARRLYLPYLKQILTNAGASKVFVTPTNPAFVGPPSTRHVMGTLRMGDSPATSVVSTDRPGRKLGQFHDVDNLFACDGSVFPTSSGYNPTLTIVALALRIARGLA